MIEIWKSIKGYENIYEVSNIGNIRSLDRISFQNNRLKGGSLNQCDNTNGYLYVDLYGTGKRKKFGVHRLAAQAFIPNPNDLPQINHKDGDRYNNNVDNLEWCTSKYNNNYGDHAIKSSIAHKGKNMGKDNVGSKKVICITTEKVFDCIAEASRFYHIENLRSHISGFCNGNKRNFKYLGKLEDGTKLTWKYYDEYLKENSTIPLY